MILNNFFIKKNIIVIQFVFKCYYLCRYLLYLICIIFLSHKAKSTRINISVANNVLFFLSYYLALMYFCPPWSMVRFSAIVTLFFKVYKILQFILNTNNDK